MNNNNDHRVILYLLRTDGPLSVSELSHRLGVSCVRIKCALTRLNIAHPQHHHLQIILPTDMQFYDPYPDITNTQPGSPEHINVLIERARLKQQLFHPLDYIAGYDYNIT